ncbi:type I restriction enzyme S subunit [Halomonas fontilapidosi]|uniref:Type I restriction enzyme S subunit n=1 Tax=Halomonas fontilapidosi TaxID=616675 RepID=A0A7W5DJ37_9GAMM|nr:restriction endonuclease subunit S [Halomonas fontilapidosi]MBB3183369.1 type I restriction enzyme S subunit [Halomonas fontilapidosi]
MRADWQTGQLGDFFEIVTGGTPPKAKKEMYGSYMPLVKPPELTGAGVQSGEDFLSEEGAAASRILPVGSVLVSCIGNLGKIGISKVELATNQQINSIKPNAGKAFPEFVFYLVQAPHFSDQLHRLASGTTVSIVNKSKFKSILVDLPSLPEQKNIVATLDEAFEGIDTVVANTEKNLANAREMFESYLSSVFSQRGDVWVERRLEEIASSTQIGLVRNRKEQGDSLEYSYVKMDNITPNNYFDSKNIVRVEAKQSEVEKYSLKKGDLLFSTRNSYELVGKSCLYDIEKKEPVLFNNNIMRIRFVEEISPNFAAYLFHSPKVKKQLENMKSGTTNVSAIYYKSLKNIRLAFPSLDTQKTICGRLDEMSARTQELEAIYQHKLTALAELKQSLLQKAFSSELTAREAEAAVEEATA